MTQMQTAHLLGAIPFEPDTAYLHKRLRIKEGSGAAADLEQMLGTAVRLAHPRAIYLESYISTRGEDWVDIEGIRFSSRVLRVNMEQAYRVFPFLATCGQELQTWAEGFEDLLERYWAEAIKESALACARQALFNHMEAHYNPGRTASMSPGSLQDWPIQEQQPLFRLFGDRAGQIGVQLTESMLMIPTKTVSGIRFPTEVAFESCQLCPREGCPGRRAPFDPTLYNSRYCPQNGQEF